MLLRKHLLGTALLATLCMSAPSGPLHAESSIRFEFDTLFDPLLADPTEPRIAVMPKLDDKELQLDIGSSADLYQNEKKSFAAGIDFATFSLLGSSGGLKFPVDTIDYLFGINATWTKPLSSEKLPFDEASLRMRLSHISAHFEDGHFDEDKNEWIDQEKSPFGIPFTYSREYVNLTAALSAPGRRVYLGYQYLIHSIPDEINPHSFQAGAELGLPYNSYIAADFKLLPLWDDDRGETDGFRGTLNLQAGMRLTSLGLESVRIACNYFSGMSRHGMYFYEDESFTSLGMIVDL